MRGANLDHNGVGRHRIDTSMRAKYSKTVEYRFVRSTKLPAFPPMIVSTSSGSVNGLDCASVVGGMLNAVKPGLRGRLVVARVTIFGITQLARSNGTLAVKARSNHEYVDISLHFRNECAPLTARMDASNADSRGVPGKRRGTHIRTARVVNVSVGD